MSIYIWRWEIQEGRVSADVYKESVRMSHSSTSDAGGYITERDLLIPATGATKLSYFLNYRCSLLAVSNQVLLLMLACSSSGPGAEYQIFTTASHSNA